MSEGEGAGTHTVASQLSGYLRAGGIITPLLTALIAFFIGGLVVALTGANPFTTYKAIFDGSGLNWLFPWISSEDRTLAALNLQQTLILTTPLILTGLAVAYAFRAGLFNIGGQGQYFAGLYIGVVVGSSLHGLPGWLHILLALVLGTLAGAVWGGIAGFLKATTGANEVITTIMLNYVALWIGVWAFGLGGPLHSDAASDKSVPISNAVDPDARLHVFWGDPELQGLHVGIFIARRGADRVLGAAEPLGRGLRGARRRLQPRRRRVRRHPRRPDLHEGDARLRRVRGARGGDRHPRLAVRGRHQRHPERGRRRRRLHRHRGRAAGAQHHDRRAVLRAAVRRAASTARPCATSTRRSSRPSWRRTSR